MKKNLIIIFFVLLITLLFFLYATKIRTNTLYSLGITKKSYCEFEISNISINLEDWRYGVTQKPNSEKIMLTKNPFTIPSKWITDYGSNKLGVYFKGMVRNNSGFDQNINEIKFKFKNPNNLIIHEAFVKKNISRDTLFKSGEGVEFTYYGNLPFSEDFLNFKESLFLLDFEIISDTCTN